MPPPENTPVYRSELNPLFFLERSARVFPNRTAVYVPDLPDHPGRSYTYKEFGRRVRSLADKFIKEGLKKGDRVAYLVPNTVAGLEAHFAVNLAGGIVVMINTRLKPSEVAYILNHSKAKFLFVDHELAPAYVELQHNTAQTKHKLDVPSLQKVVVVRDNGDVKTDPYDQFVASGEVRAWHEYKAMELEDERETISICYTSGG